MHSMSNFEYSFMVNELSPLVVNRHFDRIRKLADGVYRMKIGNTEILCELGIRLHATNYIEQSNETDKFVEKVGKELDNAKLKKIEQINNDRIIKFEFDKGQLVFEMFGDGNAILIRDGITITAVKFESWTGREIKSSSPYAPPKNTPITSFEVSEKYVIVSLMKLPLGKDYAVEILHRAKIDEKKPGNSLSGNQIFTINSEIEKLKSNPSPFVFYDGEKVVDFSLSPLSKYSKLRTQDFKTLSEAADEYYSKAEKPNPKLEKLLSRLEKQQERLESLLQEEKEFKAMGDKVYANYQEIESIISLAKSGKFEELEAKYKNSKLKIDKKEKLIEL